MLAASCSDFLEENPRGKVSSGNFPSNQSELEMTVNAIYAKVQQFQCNSNPLIVQCQGDDATSTTGSNKAAYLSADAYEEPADLKGIQDHWACLYGIIRAANGVISDTRADITTQQEYNIALGQAYYWRAFAYFNLVRIYGPLPLNLDNTPDNNQTQLTSVAGVYDQIVKDLEAAEACDLPVKYTAVNRSVGGQNNWVSAQTVKATLAAVYMNMAGYPLKQTECWAKAAAKAKEVIDGEQKYGLSLMSDWNQVHSYGNNYNSECLLGIAYNANAGGWGSVDSQMSSCHQSGKIQGGWGDFLAERRFWKNYPEGPRKDATYAKSIRMDNGELVDWWATDDGQPVKADFSNAVDKDYRPMFIAFSVNKGDDGKPLAEPYDCEKPFWGGMCINKRHQLIRYAEVLCWYAESQARAGGDLTLAKAALKRVMQRAYADQSKVAAVDGMSAAQLADQAYKEHGYEVAGYVYALVTRRADEFRQEKMKEAYDYRTSAQSEVLVPAGTPTRSMDASGKPFTYVLSQDVVVKENQAVTAPWQGEKSMYQIYPPKETEKNPNLKR